MGLGGGEGAVTPEGVRDWAALSGSPGFKGTSLTQPRSEGRCWPGPGAPPSWHTPTQHPPPPAPTHPAPSTPITHPPSTPAMDIRSFGPNGSQKPQQHEPLVAVKSDQDIDSSPAWESL